MPQLNERRQLMLTGAIALLLLVGATTIGIKGAFGAFKGGYELVGTFDAAGQGLLAGSDVKIRGVNVGEVKRIELVEGKAEITLRIEDGERVPVDTEATIRAKTLFGEKYVDLDPGPTEDDGPFLGDGDEIVNTLGGFELEAVLADVYPLLEAVDSGELMTVLHELAEGGRGLGDTINRSIVNSEKLSELFAENDQLTSRFLTDLADLSGQLADSADDILAVADAANVALPTLNDNQDDIVALLQQAGRLSSDVADLLESNRPFVDASLGDGSRTVQLLFDERDQVIPLVVGLRQYLSVFASSIRIDAGDGNLMAAVKGVLGGEVCGILTCPGTAPGPGVDERPPSGAGGPSDPSAQSSLPLGGRDEDSGPVPGDADGGLFGLLKRVLLG